MSKDQRGFSVIEILLIVIVLGLVVGGGWYLMQHNDSKKPASNSTEQVRVKAYTDSAKIYTLNYPNTWNIEEAGDCCDGEPKDYTKVSRSVTLKPSAKADIHGYGVDIQADTTDSLAKTVEQNWEDNKHEPEIKTIGGYSAKYVKVVFSGDAENYIDHNYLIVHDGSSVFITFREKYYHQYPAEDWSAAKDMDAFNRVLSSVKFLN